MDTTLQLKTLLFLLTAGAIQLDRDISTFSTTGYDLSITVTDGKSVTGPAILTVIVRGIVLTTTCGEIVTYQ